MKIAVICPGMRPDNLSRQPWYYMHEIGHALTDLGHKVCFVSDARGESSSGETDWINISSLRSFPAGVSPSLNQHISDSGYDLVFWSTGITDFLYKSSFESIPTKIIPVITSSRYFLGDFLKNFENIVEYSSKIKSLLFSPFVSNSRISNRIRSSSNISKVLFQASETMTRYNASSFDTPSTAITPTVPDRFVKLLSSSRYQEWETRKTELKHITYFGPPLPLRGVTTLVHAFKQTREINKEARLKLLLRLEHEELKDYADRLKNLCRKLNIEDVVDFKTDYLSPEGLLDELYSSKVICLPFEIVISEVPLVILESLATGIPLVTTPLAGVGEFSSPGRCVLSEASKPQILAQTLSETFSKIDSGTIPHFNQQKLLEQFSHERFKQELSSFLEGSC